MHHAAQDVLQHCPAGAQVTAVREIQGGVAVAVGWQPTCGPFDLLPLLRVPGIKASKIRLDAARVDLRVVVTHAATWHRALRAVAGIGLLVLSLVTARTAWLQEHGCVIEM